ncbi:hypothetical protein ANN_01415 [Periplaneta americana]|uniref:DUF4817 domain-containing protein n=1 Tax=Periplaneta americana TaxID=6978 RepID=A0ABQ8TUK4_PERAM|nr:hypothetical protein ANN_01415 [Periplaneta americana]
MEKNSLHRRGSNLGHCGLSLCVAQWLERPVRRTRDPASITRPEEGRAHGRRDELHGALGVGAWRREERRDGDRGREGEVKQLLTEGRNPEVSRGAIFAASGEISSIVISRNYGLDINWTREPFGIILEGKKKKKKKKKKSRRLRWARSLPSKETLRGHSDSSFRGEGYIQCCVGVTLCDMYSNEELAEIHFMYGKADGNAALARRLYQERYPQRQCPDRKTFVRLHYRLCEYGKFTSINCILIICNVSPADYPARVRFCQWFLQQCGVNPNFPALVLFTDEAQFTRDGITNFHNQHVWAYENPRATVPSHHQVRFSLNMWAGIIGDRLVGSHVLVNRLTGQAYTNFLENTIPHVLEDTPLINRQHIHFLHDGAPAHFSRTARRYLNRRFPDHG